MVQYYFYRIVCRDISITDCYVGSTIDFGQRRRSHKFDCNTQTAINYNLPVYKFIRDNGGWANWSMVLIETDAFENKMEARRRERYCMENYRAALNSRVPSRSKREYMSRFNYDYYWKNREDLHAKKKIQHDCPCGGRFTNCSRAKHYRTQIHKNYLDSGMDTSSQQANSL